MRLTATRNKARDIRLFAAVIFSAFLFITPKSHILDDVMAGLLAIGFSLVTIAIVVRAWCILYLSGHKNRQLVTVGPYSICRNPIYGSTVMGAAGIALTSGTVFLPVFVTGFLVWYFLAHVKEEERKLLQRFGEPYEAYCARTPRFIPDWRILTQPTTYDVHPQAFMRSFMDATWFIIGVGFVQVARHLHAAGLFPAYLQLY